MIHKNKYTKWNYILIWKKLKKNEIFYFCILIILNISNNIKLNITLTKIENLIVQLNIK